MASRLNRKRRPRRKPAWSNSGSMSADNAALVMSLPIFFERVKGPGPLALADKLGDQQLHRHFGWPGYDW